MIENENKGIPNTPAANPTEGATMPVTDAMLAAGVAALKDAHLTHEAAVFPNGAFGGYVPWIWHAARRCITAALAAAPAPETVKDDRLEWLTSRTNLELTWGEIDGWEDDCQWRIHSRNGGRSDRGWTLRGYGPTVEQAIDAARAAINAGGK